MAKGNATILGKKTGEISDSALNAAGDRCVFSRMARVRFAETYCWNIHSTNFYINPESIYGSDTGSAFTKKSLTSMKKLSLFCCRFSRFSLWASRVVATTRM